MSLHAGVYFKGGEYCCLCVWLSQSQTPKVCHIFRLAFFVYYGADI